MLTHASSISKRQHVSQEQKLSFLCLTPVSPGTANAGWSEVAGTCSRHPVSQVIACTEQFSHSCTLEVLFVVACATEFQYGLMLQRVESQTLSCSEREAAREREPISNILHIGSRKCNSTASSLVLLQPLSADFVEMKTLCCLPGQLEIQGIHNQMEAQVWKREPGGGALDGLGKIRAVLHTRRCSGLNLMQSQPPEQRSLFNVDVLKSVFPHHLFRYVHPLVVKHSATKILEPIVAYTLGFANNTSVSQHACIDLSCPLLSASAAGQRWRAFNKMPSRN